MTTGDFAAALICFAVLAATAYLQAFGS